MRENGGRERVALGNILEFQVQRENIVHGSDYRRSHGRIKVWCPDN